MKDLEPASRYSLRAQSAGEMIHIDIKKLGRFERVGHRITGDQSNSRGIGWDCPCPIDDASRIAFSQIMPERQTSASPSSRQLGLLPHSRLTCRV